LILESYGILAFRLGSELEADAAQTQQLMLYVLTGLVLAVLLVLVVDIIRRAKRPEETEEYQALQARHHEINQQLIRLQGRHEQLQSQHSRLQSQLETQARQLSGLDGELAGYRATEELRGLDAARRTTELDNARKALEQERSRVLECERQAAKEAERNRTRIWAIHEDSAKTTMREVCQKFDIALPTFDNTNLPDGFDPGLKPDFMVQLLGQYVIFDPKSSQAHNLQTYVQSQVKATAKKIRDSESFRDIYRTVFFVVPHMALQELRTTHFVEDGLTFHVISVEAFEPILRTLKRLEDYELADGLDPQEREDIVNVIATYDQHVRQQNATNILSTIRGLRVMSEKGTMPADMVGAVETRRAQLRLLKLSPTQLKKLVENPEQQAEKILSLIAPRQPAVEERDLSRSDQPE
jgi:hypothetical protein